MLTYDIEQFNQNLLATFDQQADRIIHTHSPLLYSETPLSLYGCHYIISNISRIR